MERWEGEQLLLTLRSLFLCWRSAFSAVVKHGEMRAVDSGRAHRDAPHAGRLGSSCFFFSSLRSKEESLSACNSFAFYCSRPTTNPFLSPPFLPLSPHVLVSYGFAFAHQTGRTSSTCS